MTLGRYSGGAVEVQLPVHSLCLFNVQWFMLGRAVGPTNLRNETLNKRILSRIKKFPYHLPKGCDKTM